MEGEWRGGEGGTDFSSSAGEAPSLSVTCEGEVSWYGGGKREGEGGGYVVEWHFWW